MMKFRNLMLYSTVFLAVISVMLGDKQTATTYAVGAMIMAFIKIK